MDFFAKAVNGFCKKLHLTHMTSIFPDKFVLCILVEKVSRDKPKSIRLKSFQLFSLKFLRESSSHIQVF